MRVSLPSNPWQRGLSKTHACPPAGEAPTRVHICARPAAARTAAKLAGVAALALSLGACSVSTKMAATDSEPPLVTSSVAKAAKAEGIDTTDAELIKDAVVKADTISPRKLELVWSNPDTGNRGTIVAIDKFVSDDGQKCKKFQTTVDTFMGISIYNGETCELRKDLWVLSWFFRDKQ